MVQQSDARLRLTDGTISIDFLDPGSGWHLEEPGWLPQLSGIKGGGAYVNPSLAEGQTLVQGEPDNVVETIPLTAYGPDQRRVIQTTRDLLQLVRQASEYWRRPHELSPVWLEFRPAGADCFTGYTWIYNGQVGSLPSPTGQPFYAEHNLARLENLALVLTREPYWRAYRPQTHLGPLFNLLRNPDFELWTQTPGAITDVEPDSWINLQSTGVTGTNNRESSIIHSGRYCLKIDVDTLYGTGRKGVYQVVAGTEDETEYTAVIWARNTGIQYGQGRLRITYGAETLDVYERADRHGWKLYTATFTTGRDDTVIFYCEIVGTGGGVVYTDAEGAVYFDSLMLLEGDYESEAIDGILPYLSSSHIANHWDQPGHGDVEAGDINFVDVWDVPGDVDALVRVEALNNTTPSDWSDPDEVIAEARLGSRRAGDVFDFDNVHDPPGTVDTTCSGDDQLTLAGLVDTWQTVTTKTISGGDITPDNSGRFRLFARVQDEIASGGPTLELRATYWLGTAGVNEVVMEAVPCPVARAWCTVDLTPIQAINWDTKFLSDDVGALGYKIEARRTNSTAGDVEFDYSLLVPTDGGIIVAEIDPPVTPDNSLVIDNTSFGSVQASAKRSGSVKLLWEDEMASATSEVYALASFEGELFVAGALSAAAGAYQTRRWDGVKWSTLTHAYIITALAEYDGTLYGGDDSGEIYEWTGSAWSNIYSTAGATQITDMAAFSGDLFALNDAGNAYRWTGAAWSNPFDVAGGGAYGKLAVYNNRLFASQGAGGGAVSVWNGTALTIVGTPDGMTQVTALTAQGGYLWIGGNGQGVAYYDGDSLTVDTSFITDLADAEQVYDLAAYDGTVYATSTWTAGRAGRVYRRPSTSSGGTWTGIPKSRFSPDYSGRVLQGHDGALFVGSIGYVGNSDPAEVLALASVDVWNKVSNYRGTLFYAPPETRHRYVLNWDREDRVHNIDDAALVGIGFVPRYYALRGKG
jgi:hypothetical protein